MEREREREGGGEKERDQEFFLQRSSNSGKHPKCERDILMYNRRYMEKER